MIFTLHMDLDNAAFPEPTAEEGQQPRMDEVARVLRRVAQSIEDGTMGDIIRDVNGNTIGRFGVG